jgi:hypothetical protein
MDRKVTLLLGALLLAASALIEASAQAPAEAPAPGATPPPRRPWTPGFKGDERHHPGGGAEEFEKFNNVRKAIEALTPEQRKRFQENFQRWINLSPEQKTALSDRETFRHKKIAEDIDAAIKEAGLDLDPARRELFAKRYWEERHRIEEQLRKDMDEKRRPLLQEVIAKLKAEFASGVPVANPDAGTPAKPLQPAPPPPPKP